MLNRGRHPMWPPAAFRFDSSQCLTHHSNFRPIFAVLGRGAGRALARSPQSTGSRARGDRDMARFEIIDIGCASLGNAPAAADTFYELGMMYSVGRSVPIDFV